MSFLYCFTADYNKGPESNYYALNASPVTPVISDFDGVRVSSAEIAPRRKYLCVYEALRRDIPDD